MSIRCFMFGHKMKWRDEGTANIGAPTRCVRCGHEVPAVVWARGGICEGKTLGNMKSRLPEPSRPAPPMPACKPPAEAVDNAAMMCEIKALREEIKRMRKDVSALNDGWRPVNMTPMKTAPIKGVITPGTGYQPTGSALNPNPPPRKP